MAMTQVGGNMARKGLVVLGGGLSGLSFLHYLRNFLIAFKKTHLVSRVTLLEANNYMGGSVKSQIYEDGLIHELGPRSIRTQGVRAQNTIALIEQLGLADRVLSIKAKSNAGSDRYIYKNDKLYKVPMSFGKVFSKLPASKTTLGAAIYREVFRAEKMDLSQYEHKDPPLYDFIKHRFGDDAAENILDPIMRGITAGDARELSTRALFSDLLDKEQAYGSVIKGIFKPPVTKMLHDELFPNEILDSKLLDQFQKEHVLSFNLSSGLQTIPEHLSNSLLNTNDDKLLNIYNLTRVDQIDFNLENMDEAPCSVQVSTVDGDKLRIDADHIVSTIPAKDLSVILAKMKPSSQKDIFADITQIPHSPVGCVCVEYRNLEKGTLPKVVESFGFLTHSKAGSRVLGISFDSAMFPEIDKEHKSFRMTCMIGGSWFKQIFGTDNANDVTNTQLEQIALEEIGKILNLTNEPYRMSTLLWKTGIAQYKPGHKERLEKVRANIQRLSIPITLLGQSYDGIAVNDVIFTARMAAYNFVKSLKEDAG